MYYNYVVEPSARGSGQTGTIDKWLEPTKHSIRRAVQQALQDRGRYSGPVDGVWGPNTIKGIQKTIAFAGFYSGPIDGAVGVNTVHGVIKVAWRWEWNEWIARHQRDGMGQDPNLIWQHFRNQVNRQVS